jgi:hypothetical protein
LDSGIVLAISVLYTPKEWQRCGMLQITERGWFCHMTNTGLATVLQYSEVSCREVTIQIGYVVAAVAALVGVVGALLNKSLLCAA